jgi:DNA-binding NtrC family response regulator
MLTDNNIMVTRKKKSAGALENEAGMSMTARHDGSQNEVKVQPREVQSALAAKRRVLIVEDNDLARKQLHQILSADPHLDVDSASDGQDALKRIVEQHYSIAITDLRLPSLDGLELISQVQEKGIPITIIVLTGYGGIDEAVRAIRLGAYDFLTKPIDVDNLRRVVERALRERTLQDEVVQLRARLQTQYSFHNILSKNAQMHRIFDLVSNIADTTSTVLIEGETGTGKEEVARAIHEASHSRKGPLIAVNCAALPENLLESELFGHEKGAFTGAMAQRRGRFELAHGGTLFIDEVGDIPAAMQAKLLRVLQERRFERVGGTESIEVDVRIIAATNRPLHRLVKQGKFREDLFYRLHVVKIELPPLRLRTEDIPLLATHFAQKYARPGQSPKQISPEAMQLLLDYYWPGNIRELENAIERGCVTSQDSVVRPENLPIEITNPGVPNLPFHIDLNRKLPDLIREITLQVEREYIRKALKKTHGHVGRCAKLCGLSRRCMTTKLTEYEIDKTGFKEW